MKWNGKTPFKKGHKIRLGMKHKIQFIMRRTGSGNPNWHGNKVSLPGLHIWVRKHFGKPSLCEVCGTTKAKCFDWANLDHKYSRERKFWKRMCRSCHMKYDYSKGFR